jgi:hypothetical protein
VPTTSFVEKVTYYFTPGHAVLFGKANQYLHFPGSQP